MAEQCARKSNEKSESICSTSNQWENLVQMSKWETKKIGTLGSRNSQSQNESEESKEQRETGT